MGRMPLCRGVQKNPVKLLGDERLNSSSSKILSLGSIHVWQQKMELSPFCTWMLLVLQQYEYSRWTKWQQQPFLKFLFVLLKQNCDPWHSHQINLCVYSAFCWHWSNLRKLYAWKNICLHTFSRHFFAKFPGSPFFACAQLGRHET